MPGHVSVRSIGGRYTTRIDSGNHTIVADEPAPAGDDAGPSPYELLLAALGACTSMTLLMYARRHDWPLDAVHIDLAHNREHASDGEAPEEASSLIDVIHRSIRLEGELSPEQRARLAEIARRCPVHRTITSPPRIVDDVE